MFFFHKIRTMPPQQYHFPVPFTIRMHVHPIEFYTLFLCPVRSVNELNGQSLKCSRKNFMLLNIIHLSTIFFFLKTHLLLCFLTLCFQISHRSVALTLTEVGLVINDRALNVCCYNTSEFSLLGNFIMKENELSCQKKVLILCIYF